MADPEIYLFTGPELGEKNDAIQNIKEAARKRNGQLDEYKYYAGDTKISQIISQIQNGGLFTSALFIVVRNAEAIKLKADIDSIASWAKTSDAAAGANTLILVSDENGVDKKLENAVPSNHKKIFWGMTEDRKPQWVNNFFKKNGFSVEPEAVDLILELIENNTESLRTECSRFFYVFEKNHTITVKDVEKILTHNREETSFSLFDAMADVSKSSQQRFENAIDILHKIILSKNANSSPVAIISGLTWSFRQLSVWHGLHAKGTKPDFAALKAAGFSSKTQQNRYSSAAKVWSNGTVASIEALLSYTDMKIRESGTDLKDTYLELLVYSIVIKNGLFPQEYEFSLN